MGVNAVNGFIPTKIQSIRISSDDCEKYGIKIEDFNKFDKNEDGLIDAKEFLGGGISEISIFNAFKTMAKPVGGFTDQKVDNNEEEQQSPANHQNKMYGLNHPNVSNPLKAQKYDYLA